MFDTTSIIRYVILAWYFSENGKSIFVQVVLYIRFQLLHALIIEFADSSTEYQNEARHQELENLFFGLKDGSLDEIADQDMADSINNIGTLVLGGDVDAQSKDDISKKRYL